MHLPPSHHPRQSKWFCQKAALLSSMLSACCQPPPMPSAPQPWAELLKLSVSTIHLGTAHLRKCVINSSHKHPGCEGPTEGQWCSCSPTLLPQPAVVAALIQGNGSHIVQWQILQNLNHSRALFSYKLSGFTCLWRQDLFLPYALPRTHCCCPLSPSWCGLCEPAALPAAWTASCWFLDMV